MSIEIINLEKGFAVKFPFDLKDNFKSVFKTAKWNPGAKQWEVGPRSGKRLEQWVLAVQDAANDIEERDTAALDAEELERLQAEITSFRVMIANNQKSTCKLIDTKSALEAAHAELKQAKAELEAEKIANATALAEARELVENACDISTVLAAQRIMQTNHNQVGAQARNAFRDAQKDVSHELERLKKIGFMSKGLYELATANFNRPERDQVYKVDMAMILDIWKIED